VGFIIDCATQTVLFHGLFIQISIVLVFSERVIHKHDEIGLCYNIIS